MQTGLVIETGEAREVHHFCVLAGYGADSDGGEALPKVIRAAMLLVIGHLYEHRSENTEVALQSLPLGVGALLRPRRVRLGMA